MTWWKKLNIGPLSSVRCVSCGKRLRDSSFTPIIVMLGTLAGGLAANRMPSLELGFLVIAIAAIASLAALVYWVPVVGRDDT
jgi:hypothetical protein